MSNEDAEYRAALQNETQHHRDALATTPGLHVVARVMHEGFLGRTTFDYDEMKKTDPEAMMIREGKRQMALDLLNRLGVSVEDAVIAYLESRGWTNE